MGDDKPSMYGFAVVAFLIVLTGPALNAAYVGAPAQMDVVDEPIDVDYNNTTSVDNAGTGDYSDEVTIESQSGVVLEEGVDYSWNSTTGSVTWFDTGNGNTQVGDTARIDYWYSARTQATENVWSILSGIYGMLGAFVLVAALRAVLEYALGDKNPLRGGL